MAETPTRDVTRQALAARLRQLRVSGLANRPLNRKELGKLLGEAMNRPAGPYAARRVGDFENPDAKSPPPPDALRGYAQVFGYTPDGDAGVEPLEHELLTLRDGIEAPPPEEVPPVRRRRAIVVIAGAVAVVVVATAVLLATRSGSPAEETFCVRNVEAQPAAGAVGVVCARDVRLRPFPGAPADQALGTVVSGTKFEIDRFSSSGAWAHGTARLPDGGTEGWIEGGWFCPPGIESPASSVFHRRRTLIRWSQ